MFADQPGRQVGDTEPRRGAEEQRFGVVRGQAHASRTDMLQLAIYLEAPGIGRCQGIPIEAVMLG
ncbi:hypothetical protein D3C84_982000 [compost metagenome]